MQGKADGNFQPEFQRVDEDRIQQHLSNLVNRIGHREPILTAKEIEDVIGGSYRKSSIYGWLESGKIPAAALIAIAQEAYRRGDSTLMDLINPTNYSLKPNGPGAIDGSVDDQIAASAEHYGRARRCFLNGDMRGFTKAISGIEEEIETMKAEGRAKR
jgi:hypothetical protein